MRSRGRRNHNLDILCEKNYLFSIKRKRSGHMGLYTEEGKKAKTVYKRDLSSSRAGSKGKGER